MSITSEYTMSDIQIHEIATRFEASEARLLGLIRHPEHDADTGAGREIDVAVKAIHDEMHGMVGQLCDIRATSFAGIKAKARVAKIMNGCEIYLGDSIIQDVLGIAEEVATTEMTGEAPHSVLAGAIMDARLMAELMRDHMDSAFGFDEVGAKQISEAEAEIVSFGMGQVARLAKRAESLFFGDEEACHAEP